MHRAVSKHLKAIVFVAVGSAAVALLGVLCLAGPVRWFMADLASYSTRDFVLIFAGAFGGGLTAFAMLRVIPE